MPADRGVRAVCRLLGAARLVNVGHGRDSASIACAAAFLDGWRARGGEVGAVVDWPRAAASWLRPARRLAAGGPDAWVVSDTGEGWSGIAPRLVNDTDWDPARTVAFGPPAMLADASFDATEGMRGVTSAGGRWLIVDGALREW
jgi:hypothetical protein